MSIDVAALKASVSIVDVVGSYVTLKKAGKEYKGLCPFHADTNPSFYVIPEKGFCHCFSCGWPNGKSGDVIAFIEDMEHLDFESACARLGAKNDWQPRIQTPQRASLPARVTCKPPPDAPTPEFTLKDYGEPSHIWPYRDTDGGILGYVTRYESGNGTSKKEIRAWTYGARGEAAPAWACGSWSKPRPLYRLDALAERPNASVLIVEGEKAADAAQRLLPGYIATTWPGGAQAWKHADWEPLHARKLLLWPDADLPGWEAMQALARILADPLGLNCAVRIIDTNRMPDGWDAADSEKDGMDTAAVIAWAKPRASDFKPVAQAEQPSEGVDTAPSPAIPPPVAAGPIPVTLRQEARQRDGDLPPLDTYEIPAEAEEPPPPPDPDDEILPASLSEDALAQYFAAQHSPRWRYVHHWSRWFQWREDGWYRDDTQLIKRLAVEVTRQALYWEDAKRLSQAGRAKVNSKGYAGNLMALAEHDRRIAARPEQWDADPWLLGVPGGAVDLRTGKLVSPNPEHYITRRTAVAPAAGPHPLWDKVFARACHGDADIAAFLQRWCGYMLTGHANEEAFLFIQGPAASGKGTFVKTIGEIMGDYARSCPIEVFEESKGGSRHPTELARLAGSRLVYSSEVDEGSRWNESRIKWMTGRGRLVAHFMRQDDFEFDFTAKIVIEGNWKPALKSVGEEIRRRLHLIEFPEPIPEHERDHQLKDKLIAEYPAILAWMIEGAVIWADTGLGLPEAVSDNVGRYLNAQDTLGAWIAECVITEPNATELSSKIWNNYRAWTERNGESALGRRRFADQLEARGVTFRRGAQGMRLIQGLQLKNAEEPKSYADRD